jgi:tetratricopeptide (TPR) repeat protein/predicted Ser/Thr protein kinase
MPPGAAPHAALRFLESPAIAFLGPLLATRALGTELEGHQVGPYRIVRELARGGMGVVYLAERADGQFEQRVALKLIKRGMDSDEIHRRFLAERQILAQLNHPHIARFYDGGVTGDGRPWFAMEYVEGRPITRHCEERRLGVPERLRLFQDVCDAVRYAHQNLVVHRDLKPSNILVSESGEVRLLDFGIAKLLESGAGAEPLTRTELRALTPEYAAPEQVRGEPVTTATDVYALGGVLYELLAGRRAFRFERHTPAELERVICTVDPPPPGVSGDLDTIVLKALQKDPARRYSSAEALLDDLRRQERGLPVRARPASVGYRTLRFVQRHRVAVIAGGAVLLALVGGLGATLWQARVAGREAARAGIVRDFVVRLFEVAYPHRARGRPVTALDMLELGAERAQTELVREPAAQAELLHILSAIYRDLGQYGQALPLIRKSTEISVRTYGPDHLFVAQRKLTWGRILYYMADYAVADSLLSEVVTAYLRVKGPRHPETGTALLNLAYVRNATADYASAEALQREALDIDRAWYGDDDLATAWNVSNLGETLLKEGKVAEADSVHTEALRVRQLQLDANHDELMISLNNLGLVRLAQGRHSEAEGLLREAEAKRRRWYPEGHPRLAVTLSGLGEVLLETGRAAEAESLLAEAVAMRETYLGADHPETFEVAGRAALAAHRRRRAEGVEDRLRQTVGGLERGFGADHPATATALVDLAEVVADAGRIEAADSLLRRALAIRRARLGGSHPLVGRTMAVRDRLLAAEASRPR